MNSPALPRRFSAFTLIELLVVISILAVLAGLAFPVLGGVMDRAKKVQAKNDVSQIVLAVSAYYTEYGRYPVQPAQRNTEDAFFGMGDAPTGTRFYDDNSLLLDVLRYNTGSTNSAVVTSSNPRQIVFISPGNAKGTSPRFRAGVGANGIFYDPWGSQYNVIIDTNYDDTLSNPYSDTDGSAGGRSLRTGAIAFSHGKNGARGGGPPASSEFSKEPGSADTYKNSADVLSWQ